MLNSFVEVGIYLGYDVGSLSSFRISHHPFADTLIMGEKTWDNIRTLKSILMWDLIYQAFP